MQTSLDTFQPFYPCPTELVLQTLGLAIVTAGAAILTASASSTFLIAASAALIFGPAADWNMFTAYWHKQSQPSDRLRNLLSYGNTQMISLLKQMLPPDSASQAMRPSETRPHLA